VKGAIVFGPVRALCEPQIGDEQVRHGAMQGDLDSCRRSTATRSGRTPPF
jgi:hypothetical protein